MALFRRTSPPNDPPSTPPVTAVFESTKKDRPTPSRKEAEAARRQRVNRTLNKKEARAETSRQNRAARMRTTALRDSTPDKALIRDYIDSRFNIGEFLLPSLVVILALSFLNSVLPGVTVITTVVMYLFIIAVIIDGYLMWRGFKRVLAARMPGTSTRGLLMYGMNRSIQIRRFRIPPPRIKRGDKY